MTEFVLSIFIFLLIQMAVCQPSIYNNQKIETRTIDEKSISRAMGQEGFIGIGSTGLILPHVCVRPKTGIGFPMFYMSCYFF
jgi:hypothetical protein